MNSENGFCFEVPIINLHNVEIPNIGPNSDETEDEDCTIIEPRNFIKVSIEESIVLDEDSERENDCSIIDTYTAQEIQLNNDKSSRNRNISTFDEIYKQNKLLAELIENCLDMENSMGMLRIINRTLIPIYYDTSKDFKRSNYFQKVLLKTIRKLAVEPGRKFTHLKELCEVMKHNLSAPWCHRERKAMRTCKKKTYKNVKAKNRVQLKRKLPGKSTSSETNSSGIPKKKANLDIIDLDDDDVIIANTDQISNVECEAVKMSFILSSINNNTVETTYNAEDIHVKINEHNSMNDEPIETDDVANELSPTDDEANELRQTDDEKNNLDPTDDETNELSQTDDETNDPSPTVDETNEHTEIDDDIILIEDKNQNSNKENITVTSEQTKNHTSNIFEKRCAEKVQNKNINNKASERYLNNYEESFNATTHVNILPEDTVKRKIEELEKRIKSYHELIEQLEQKEVDWDSTYNSPYLQSELFKAKVISLYKELCKLSGTDSVKRHKVRLKVVQGRHEGPVRYLEKFINDNIGEDGKPPFPDMYDVIECVRIANTMYRLGWSEKQVENEAQALFIHYGRMVQMRRQKREWRDLMLYVKEKVPDPADDDPALQARLNENAKLASKNEKELFDRYVQIENSSRSSIARINLESSVSDNEISSVRRRIVPNRVFNSATLHNTTVFSNETILNNSISMSSDGKSSNHFQTNNGETSSVRKKNVPIRVAVPDSATAHNSATLHNNTTVLNNETVPISATITNSASVLNSATVPNNSTSLNSNKTSSNFQTTDNEVNYNPNVIIQQLIIPPEMATYPIKYIVVDDNMQPIGIIANPQQNSGPTSNIESLKKYMPDNTKDTREITNSSNTVDSTVQQHNNGEIINLSCMKPGLKDMRTASIENTEVSTGSTAIAGINSVNKNSFESTSKNSKAYVDINRGLKSNIGYFITKSLQNNEVSTNSDADFITINDVEDEHVSQKSTENESRSCELQLHTGSTASDKTCGIVNDAGSSNTDLNKIIKKEKLDIPRMLEALGDNYTVKILSIEDPFEVIGISDSSDSEDGL